MDLEIDGKTALVTGASGGIGRETVRRLVEAGVTVTATDLNDDDLAPLRAEFGVTCIAGDLSSVDGVEALLAETGKSFDILAHLAGVTGAKGDPLKMAEEDWSDAYSIDFMSAVRLSRHLCPPMIERGWGRVVFVTSENVAQPYPEEAVYNASKSALLSFAKSVAMAHSGSGMMVNCIAPAFIETPMTDGMMEKRAKEEGTSKEDAIESFLAEKRPYLVVGRRGKPEEVAPIIAILCSEHASFVTGSNWRIDGGAVGSINV